MENLRCAVIGLGMGMGHLRGYLENPRAEVVGLVDLDEERLARGLKDAPGAKGYTDFEKMLRECKPQVVSVALPNFLHEPVTIACLEAGADVLCEKPMSSSLASALRMEQAVEKTGKRIFMNLSQRFKKENQAARELMESGAFGEVYHAYTEWTRRDWIPGFGGWFGQKELSGGGPMLDIGIHKIDMALWLMGRPKPVTVSGITHHQRGMPLAKKEGVKFDVEDYATGFVRFENGASLIFEASWAGYQQTYSQESFKLIGTRGGLEIAEGKQGLDYIYNHEVNGVPLASRLVCDKMEGKSSTESLVDCILDDKPFRANMEDGIRMQVILEALYESANRGSEVNIAKDFPDAFALL
ncbi:Gfo/Idh/MocA family oxidoreductase [Kiritimatiellaeota bacterium B1221]|nr:Gfo/Idh/MocA family oxidoreductase [Kiritimatiellaeota bacterium B1221]